MSTVKLMQFGGGQGFLKSGFLGFQASGKTFTASLLAIGTRRAFGLEGPIAMFDTEGGGEYVSSKIEGMTGKPLIGVRSRSFDDLIATGDECIAVGVSVLIVDSVTHVWRELCDAHLQAINESRASKRLPRRTRLEFQDWASLKSVWGRWTDFYLNAPLHIIIAGRAGYEYDMAENEETGRKELVKTGIKMRVEGEFGYEPSLLVEMERSQISDGKGHFRLARRAVVLKDRFGMIDGAEATFAESNPEKALEQTWAFFAPHVERLRPGSHAPIDVSVKTIVDVDEAGDTDWARERKARTILSEEIQAELVAAYPGQDAQSKRTKAQILWETFGTRSWTAVESMASDQLRAGLAAIRARSTADTASAGPPEV